MCRLVTQCPGKVQNKLLPQQQKLSNPLSLRPPYEEQIIKRYLNSTFNPPIVLLTIKSKLEDIYGLKDRQRNKCRVMVFFRDLKLRNGGKSEPCDLLLKQEQFPAIFPRLLSFLVWSVLSREAQAHHPQRYFNSSLPSSLPSPLHIPWKPSSQASSEERNTDRGCNDWFYSLTHVHCVCITYWFW